MRKLKCYVVCGLLFVLITGTLFHFLYEWTGNSVIVGLFSPVNESIWEHMKLVFFPMLLYSFLMIPRFKNDCPCISSAYCFGMLLGTILIPVFFYAYTFLTGRDVFFLDLADFVFSVVTAFLVIYRLTLNCRAQAYSRILFVLTGIFIVCFMIFSCNPPYAAIFTPPV
ncbi:MAG: hypothetical protein HFI48_13735 [Lachnospiraceae bacterium]|nr:hypothetical protein [Lachnospiraceae bacterium]